MHATNAHLTSRGISRPPGAREADPPAALPSAGPKGKSMRGGDWGNAGRQSKQVGHAWLTAWKVLGKGQVPLLRGCSQLYDIM